MEIKTKEIVETTIIKQSENIPEIVESEKENLDKALQELDIKDRTSIIYFGSNTQKKLDEISTRMIDGVQNNELGVAGEALNKMVLSLRGFDMDKLNPNQKLSWWQKLIGTAKPMVKFIQEYEEVRDQIDTISNELEKHKAKLLKDIVSLDKLYEANLEYFRNLEIYIQAGDIKLKELEETILPQYEEKVQNSQDDMMVIQELKELRGYRDELERRVYDLRLSRQVTMQALPSIRLIQENNKSLISKITSTLVNTVPLWRNQLAQTVAIFRSHDAALATKNAADLTNELLEKNAQGLRDANIEIRTQMERGIFDIDSIKKANQTFIDTLNDSLRIANEGKKAREEAIKELNATEEKLKNALLSTKTKLEEIETKKEI